MLAILMHGWVSAAHMPLVIVPTVPLPLRNHIRHVMPVHQAGREDR